VHLFAKPDLAALFQHISQELLQYYIDSVCFRSVNFISLGCSQNPRKRSVIILHLSWHKMLQIVKPEPDTSAKQGDAIKSGTIIRLQHMRTRKWLHSHLHSSPITGNMEVTSTPFFFVF